MDTFSETRGQAATPELRQWIIEQHAAGHSHEAIVRSMLTSGWQADVARQALDEVLQPQAAAATPAVVAAQPEPQALLPVEVPQPRPADGGNVVWAGDREVRILLSLQEPRVLVLGGLLSDEECDELVAMAGQRLVRSETVEPKTGASEVNVGRTSEGMFFQRGENPLCARIEARIAALTRWPIGNGEGLQVLKYGPGAEYRPHYDYFDLAQPGTPNILKRGGQRVATLVMYLNTPERGGSTVFPDVELDVGAIKGNAVFFSYDRAHPDTKTLHGGSPVLAGEKWVATKWLRQGHFV